MGWEMLVKKELLEFMLIRLRTKETEEKYKKFKSKLVWIIKHKNITVIY